MANNLLPSTIVRQTAEKVKRELVDINRNDKLQPMITLSFDDGYDSDYNIVRPIFERLGMQGTFFVITDFIGSTLNPKMTEEEIKEMHELGHEIGSHTKTHPDLLTELTDEEIIYDLRESKKEIQEITGYPCTSLCYPRGNNNARVVNLVQGFYDGARAITVSDTDPEVNPNDHRGNQGTPSPYSNPNLSGVTVYGTRTHHAIVAKSADPLSFNSWKNIIDDFLELEEPAWMVFMFHRIHADSDTNKPNNRMNETLFTQCMEYLRDRKSEGEVDVVPFRDGLRRIQTARSIYLE